MEREEGGAERESVCVREEEGKEGGRLKWEEENLIAIIYPDSLDMRNNNNNTSIIIGAIIVYYTILVDISPYRKPINSNI